ncbi:MAG: hypothetical protein ACR2HQ_02010, partial [Ilumatobacteraceae bacterium]
MEMFGLADPPGAAPVDAQSSIEEILEFVATAEEGFEALFAAVVAGLPGVQGVERTVEVIRGIDGNDVTLYVHRPTGHGDG